MKQTLKRAAWAFGCEKKGTPEETNALDALKEQIAGELELGHFVLANVKHNGKSVRQVVWMLLSQAAEGAVHSEMTRDQFMADVSLAWAKAHE